MMGGVIGGMMGGQFVDRFLVERRAERSAPTAPRALVRRRRPTRTVYLTAPGLVVEAACRLFADDPDGGQSPERTFVVTDTEPIDLGDVVLLPR